MSFEGPPRRKARLCEGGRWEGGYGCTTWPDGPPYFGRPVKQGDTFTDDDILNLLAYHLREKEEAVERLVNVPLLQHQYDALVSRVFNIGPGEGPEDGFADSTILKMLNATGGPRWMDAADAFAKWIFATKQPHQRKADEPVEWYTSPDGRAVPYKHALKGLLRRCHAEALMMMGKDWKQACGPDSPYIKLETRIFYNAKKDRNEDEVILKTEFSEIWDIARHYPLPSLKAAPAPDPKPAAVAPSPVAAPKPSGPPPVIVPPPGDTKPQITPPPDKVAVDVRNWDIGKIRVENGAKVMEMSDRAVAVGLKLGGIGIKTFVERRVIPPYIGGLYYDAMGDPLIVGTLCIVIPWGIGWLLHQFGRFKRAEHTASASTLTV
jgi:GH24 family phage-related lysozyme (muramidase)